METPTELTPWVFLITSWFALVVLVVYSMFLTSKYFKMYKAEKLRQFSNDIERDVKAVVDATVVDLSHNAGMAQARILSPIIGEMNRRNLPKQYITDKVGMSRDRVKGLLVGGISLTIEDISLFEEALEIVLQPPVLLSDKDHKKEFYGKAE